MKHYYLDIMASNPHITRAKVGIETHLSVPVVVAGDLSGVNVPLVLLAAADILVHPLQVGLVRGVDRAE